MSHIRSATLCGHAGNLGPDDCVICLREKLAKLEGLGYAASEAIFAFEQALGEPGSDLRQRMYRARIEINEVRHALRIRKVW